MSSDAIVVLKADHKEIRNLFREFQAAGDRAVKKKAKIVAQTIERLTVHTYIENEVMYPEVCAPLPTSRTTCWSPTNNIYVADVLCMELAGMPWVERFDAKASRAYLERHASHRGGGAGLVPQGAGRSRPQTAAGNSGPSSSGNARKRPGRPPSPVR